MRGAILALMLFAALPSDAAPADSAPGSFGLAIGMNALRWQDDADLRADFADFQRLGVRWLRTDLYWADVQGEMPQRFDWSDMDRVVMMARQHGIQVLPVVGTAPSWARGDRAEGAPIDQTAFGRFMIRAIERYRPMGVHAWEIWNEPNLAGNWGAAPDPAAYGALLQTAAQVIRQFDEDGFVVMGGLSPVAETGPEGKAIDHMAAPEFLRGVFAAGAGDAFDALGFHPYGYPAAPGEGGPHDGWKMMSAEIRAIMTANGAGDKPIWITEYGAPTNAPYSGVTEADQAAFLTRATRLSAATEWAGPMFWYSYRDIGGGLTENEAWFGLLDTENRQKPAWKARESTQSAVEVDDG